MSDTPKWPEGPWEIEYENDVGPNDDYFVQWYQVGPAQVHFDRNDDGQAKAVAHLIAAAAELYEALEAITDCYFLGTDVDEFIKNVDVFMKEGRYAVRKARRETE